MKALLAGAALLAVNLAAIRQASADACHGSSAGGSHGGGGGSSDDSSSGSSCSEVSDVVGHQRCTRFGAGWAGRARLPALSAEVGVFTRALDTGFTAAGAMEHDTATVAYSVAPDGDRSTAAGAAMRLSMALPAHLYIGADLELGGLLTGTGADVEMVPGQDAPTPSMTASRRLYMGAGGVAGVRGRLGPAALSAELVAGLRDVSLSVESHLGTCILSETHHRLAAFAEPRIRLDLWLTPWVTLAAFAGSDINGNSRMIGSSLSFHLRAFDRGL
jgi:hypothetical protein